jgi:spore maturation protein CgeB
VSSDLRARLRDRVLKRALLRRAWGRFRELQMHRDYVARRDRYARLASERDLVYRREDTEDAVRRRIAGRGWETVARPVGDVHTFAVVAGVSWHESLIHELRELGPVSRFDYTSHGYRLHDFYPGGRRGAERRTQMNAALLDELRHAHHRRPVDWVFAYASGGEIGVDLLERIAEELGIPTVGMYLDDKHGWEGNLSGQQRTGQVALASAFDLAWTSARVACEWYMLEGGRPIYLPEGFDVATYRPLDLEPDMDVSFIGAAYGYRPQLIGRLRKAGINVDVFGPGWKGGGWVVDPATVISRSRINLGMGGIGYSQRLVNLKGRDFEIPAVGRGVYLTSYNPDLAEHFDVGREILCYGNEDEAIELIRHYLDRPDEARRIARRGRERCLREHRWRHRFETVCRILGTLEP